ncbi:MAG: ATP-dependent Clp protease ATP-binding subunit ClpA [Halobacteriovoraceae bacterium]|jgi:ATP-dependent Clp protease ATP-binding subunit ClpA|nr:ATP-dependent Clp protease ATP-binding subunit ClpA [Halobacteriovoraceae bacterium]MBT5094634.1 ATP-dependent Clp protease ATP-binding subunit ClpA [Halobacteriovoraceae bacterium]
MMSQKIEVIINAAIVQANELKHEYLTLEALLFAMLDDQHVCELLQECGAVVPQIKEDLVEFLKDDENFSVLDPEQIEALGQEQFVDEELRKLAAESGINYQPEISMSLQRVIQRAAIHVQSSGKKQIHGINLLVAMFQEKESFALFTLTKQGVERFDLVKKISHGVDGPLTDDKDSAGSNEDEELLDNGENQGKPKKGKKRNKSYLEQFCLPLNDLAKKGRIDPIIGRDNEIERIVQTLCRRRKNNPLLVGDAGVGKTALAEGLAIRIVEGNVPEVLAETVIFSLDMASLLAGAKYRGDFEQRLKGVLKELGKMADNGKDTVLFIDELHTVMGAGATAGGSMDASNLLKPALSGGKIRCLGSTTYEEYRKFIEKDPAFSRRFQKIDVDEPNPEDTLKILQGLRSRFEKHHSVKYSKGVLKLAVDLSEKYITDRKNPDKSIDVIDEAGAKIQLLPAAKRRQNISKKDIEQVVAQLAKIPQVTVVGSEKEKLQQLEPNIKLAIFGQDKAVEKVSDAILLARSGLGDENRPMGAFLFAGPTGVGKTELAKQLALQLGSQLERFDMSEFMEKHSVSKLIGAPPGYVGHDRGGILTDAIKKHPHCVLLLDEIEKAHPDIFNILLQVMDHGVLTDSHGRKTDFKNVILIMTTNAGAKDLEAGSIGLSNLGAGEVNINKRDQAIKNGFSPEFRNRLDAIVHFNKLQDQQILKIVDKFLYQLENKLAAKNVDFVVEDEAKAWLAKKGYDPKMGARPLGRLIDTEIKKLMSQELLFGRLEKGGKVTIFVKEESDGESSLQFRISKS